MTSGMVFDIVRGSYVDGPGIRTTVFLKGCNLRCVWCHNPESQSAHPEMMFYKNKCTNCGKCKEKCAYNLEKCDLCGKCTLFCPMSARKVCGKEYSADEILREVVKDKRFYENSGGGVTFSGGECMLQIDFLEDVLSKCRDSGISTAVDTAGNVPFEYFERIMPYTDLFLYDVKCADSDLHKRYTGVPNDLILENLSKLLTLGKCVWVRIPIIPGVNDSVAQMEKIRSLFGKRAPVRVELLPYHPIGEHKYHAIGKKPTRFSIPEPCEIAELSKIFE